jgi:uncharacterized membrane protein
MSEIPPGTPPPDAGRSGWTAGRVVAVVLGSIASLIGVALLLGGVALILAHAFARDSDGYYTTGTERLATDTYALTAEDIDLGSQAADAVPEDVLGRIRIRAERPGGRPVFVGIGPEREVDAYIRGVAHAEVDDFDPPRYLTTRGSAPRRPPSDERFWVASTQGSGRQAVSWEVEGGQWTIVAMNADGARRVVVDADVGAKVGWFLGVGIGLLVVGFLILAGGVALIVAAARRASRRATAPSSSPNMSR